MLTTSEKNLALTSEGPVIERREMDFESVDSVIWYGYKKTTAWFNWHMVSIQPVNKKT